MTGAATEAAKRLDAALAKQHSVINDADDQLADAVLKASSSSAEGKRRLQALQQDIIDEVDKLGPTLDTAAGQQQMAEFLQGKTNDILNVLKNASLDSESQAAVLDGLAARYAAIKDKSPAGDGAGNPPGDAKGGTPKTTGGGQTDTAGTSTGATDDPLLGGLPSDPLSALMPAMGALGGLPAAMGSMLPGFGGGGGLGGGLPLGDLGSAIGGLHDADNHQHDADTKPDEHADPLKDRSGAGDDKPQNTQPAGLSDPSDKSGTQNAGAGGAPPAAAAAATGQPQGQPTQVVLPDNSVRTAATPALAQAARAVLSGEGIDDAFGKAGLQLPPLGAPVTSPLSPSRLELGDLGQYTDHRVMALGKNDVWANGQVTPIGQLEAGQNFLGWTRAATPAATTGAAPQPAQPQ